MAGKSDTQETETAAEPLQAQITALRGELAELGTHVASITRRRAAGLKSAAQATAAEGYHKGEEAVDVVLAELKSLENELADATRRRPFASLGLAALVGFLVGVLFPALSVRLLSSLAGIAETRLRNTARRARLRAVLIAACTLAGLIAFGFALAALVVALAHQVGVVPALWITAGVALLVLLALLVALQSETRRHRSLAAERERLDRQLYRAAALSALPRSRRLSRTGIGLGLVALGSLLVLLRRD